MKKKPRIGRLYLKLSKQPRIGRLYPLTQEDKGGDDNGSTR